MSEGADSTSTKAFSSGYGCLSLSLTTDKSSKTKNKDKWIHEITVPTVDAEVYSSASNRTNKNKNQDEASDTSANETEIFLDAHSLTIKYNNNNDSQNPANGNGDRSQFQQEITETTITDGENRINNGLSKKKKDLVANELILGPFQSRKFLPFCDWCREYEPLTFKELNIPYGERRQKGKAGSTSEDWVLSKLISLAAPRIENRLVALVTENLSKVVFAGEQQLIEQGEIHLSLFLNGLNGYILSYRFQKTNPKLVPRMNLFRDYAIDLMYHSFHRAVLEGQQKVDTENIQGSMRSLGTMDGSTASEQSEVSIRSRALIKQVLSTMEKTLYDVIDEKQKEAKVALEKSTLFMPAHPMPTYSDDIPEDAPKTSGTPSSSRYSEQSSATGKKKTTSKKKKNKRVSSPLKFRRKNSPDPAQSSALPGAPIFPEFTREFVLSNWDSAAQQLKETITLSLNVIANEYAEQKEKLEFQVETQLKDLTLSNQVEHNENKRQLTEELRKAHDSADRKVRDFARATVRLFEALVR